jgi:hypothetical protein
VKGVLIEFSTEGETMNKCESCGSMDGKHKATTPQPDIDDLERWMFDGIALATDGCTVEPDGICPHRHKSWLLVLGLI